MKTSTSVENKKLCHNSGIKSLHTRCNWNDLNNTAIEYHDLNREVIRITYAQLNTMLVKIRDILTFSENFEFIGISHDILEYCIPPMILGIIAANHAFINLPGPINDCLNFLDCLNVKYLFACRSVPNTTILIQFEIHGVNILLLELQKLSRKKQSFDSIQYAYAITTSGSTNVPKIVKVPHFCIVPNIEDFQKVLNVTKQDKILQMTSFTFDPSIIEVFLAFTCGGTLIMVSKDLKCDADRLLQSIYENGVTILQSTPSVLLRRWSSERLKSTIFNVDSPLRILLLGGDPFPNLNVLKKVIHAQNKTRIFNVYGITEISCWASINEIVKDDNEADPTYLGSILSETIFQIRSEKEEIIQKGEGTLYIGSNSRICTIDNETFLDIKRPVFRDTGDFVRVDEKGRIFYKGRKNRIIKRLGNRLNLRKLDECVQELESVQCSYAWWDIQSFKLILFVTTTESMEKHANLKANINEYLGKLPAFYKPDIIFILERFELTTNGKICIRFLDKICTEYIARNNLSCNRRDAVEMTFKNIWTNYIRFKDHGFIKSGGTSVDALQISLILSDTLQFEFPKLIGMLLQNATFNECLNYINHRIFYCNVKSQSTRPISIISKLQTSEIEKVLINNYNTSNKEILTSLESMCLWQKCRGRTIGQLSEFSKKSTITKIKVMQVFNLQKCVDASPTVFRYSDDKLFVTVGSHSGMICTLEIESTSIKLHEIKLPDRIEAAVLVLHHFQGVVGCYDGFIYSLNLKTGKLFWKFQTKDIVKCTAISCQQGKLLYVGSYDCYVYCLAAKDGREIWKVKVSEGSVSATGCLYPQTSSVLFGTLDGTCVALDQQTGKLLWCQQLKQPIFTAPVVLNNGLVIFCTVAGTIHCFNIETKEKIWTYAIDGNVFSYPVIQQNWNTKCESLVIVSTNNNLYNFEWVDVTKAKVPELKYLLNFKSAIYATPWYENDILFVACTDGTCQTVRHSTGQITANIKLSGECFSSPVFVDNLAFVGCRDNNLYVLKFY